MESNSFFRHLPVQIMLALALLVSIMLMGALTQFLITKAEQNPYGPATISVNGYGEVVEVPDVGNFTFAVQAEGETADEAQSDSAESLNAILAFLEEQGVEEEDVKTTNYNLTPRYRYEERICPQGSFCPPGERVQDGFTVNQSVTVKVRDTSNTGALLTGVGERGATNISSIYFTTDDDEALKSEARAKAIADAKAKATVLARDLGVRLVRITNYYEDNNRGPVGYGGEMAMDMAFAEESRATPNVPTGENTTASNVTIVFEIR